MNSGVGRQKWVLADERTLAFGAHLGTPRLGYLHHGIYVGGGRVVHYAGYVHGVRRGPVEEIELARFRDGRSLWLASGAKSLFESSEVIRRARSRLGESRYRLMTNNCEHFCEWCVTGEPRSFQVDAWLAWPRRAVAMLVKTLADFSSRFGQIGSGRVNIPLSATDARS
jgi:Lecithin retinol acyltransferase